MKSIKHKMFLYVYTCPVNKLWAVIPTAQTYSRVRYRTFISGIYKKSTRYRSYFMNEKLELHAPKSLKHDTIIKFC